MSAATVEERQEAADTVRHWLTDNPALVVMEDWGKRGANGHAVVLVRVFVVREYDGVRVPIEITPTAATATGRKVRKRGSVAGIPIQSGAQAPGAEVYGLVLDAVGMDESGVRYWDI